MGIKSSFVRTPKYNIVGRTRLTTDTRQKILISNNLIIEGLLMAFHYKEYSFFVFHLMLALGFGSAFIVSWQDR